MSGSMSSPRCLICTIVWACADGPDALMGNAEKVGWTFFVAGSVVFTGVGVATRDWWVAFGGALYLVGCAALLKGALGGSDA